MSEGEGTAAQHQLRLWWAGRIAVGALLVTQALHPPGSPGPPPHRDAVDGLHRGEPAVWVLILQEGDVLRRDRGAVDERAKSAEQ